MDRVDKMFEMELEANLGIEYPLPPMDSPLPLSSIIGILGDDSDRDRAIAVIETNLSNLST